MNPVISVIILTMNSERYIERCLRSLERQTLGDFEAVVIDAGSKDGTKKIFQRFGQRFTWLELPGSDMGMARNFGIRHSRGGYITFLDSDDFYLPTKLEVQVASLKKNPGVDVTFCEAWHFRTERPDRLGLKKNPERQWSLRDFFAGHNRNLNTMCMRRAVWERGFTFGEGDRGRYGEEWRLQLSMAAAGVPMNYRAEPLAVVEIRPDSHTTWPRQWIMKSQAIAELERVAAQLTPIQLEQVDCTAVMDTLRVKLVAALLLSGRRDQVAETVKKIATPQRARQARLLWLAMRFIPAAWTKILLCRLWLIFQDRSFCWEATPAAVRPWLATRSG